MTPTCGQGAILVEGIKMGQADPLFLAIFFSNPLSLQLLMFWYLIQGIILLVR
jgi:hypothetical protein